MNLAYKTVSAQQSAPTASAALPFTKAVGYDVYEIQPENTLVSKFMKLHHQVLKSLPAHGQHWVKRRLFTDVKDHLNKGHLGLGVYDPYGNMIGQVLLTFPDLLPQLKDGKALKGYPLGTANGLLPPEHCMVIQTLGVSPKHQGKGIRTALLEKAEEIAHERFRRHLLAKTDVKNLGSVKGFESAGYASSGETSVIGEKYTCVFMYKPLKHADVDLSPFGKLHFPAFSA